MDLADAIIIASAISNALTKNFSLLANAGIEFELKRSLAGHTPRTNCDGFTQLEIKVNRRAWTRFQISGRYLNSLLMGRDAKQWHIPLANCPPKLPSDLPIQAKVGSSCRYTRRTERPGRQDSNST